MEDLERESKVKDYSGQTKYTKKNVDFSFLQRCDPLYTYLQCFFPYLDNYVITFYHINQNSETGLFITFIIYCIQIILNI